MRIITAAVFLIGISAFGHGGGEAGPYFVRVKALDKFDRTKIVNLGVSIEAVRSDSVYGLASERVIERLRASDAVILESFRLKEGIRAWDFPPADASFHNYQELTKELERIVDSRKDIMRLFSIGKTLENRDIWAVQINTTKAILKADLPSPISGKPGIVFMGNHHAREHVSAEIPLMLLDHLAKNYGTDPSITGLLDRRDVYVIPMVNPDGVEYDITQGRSEEDGNSGEEKPGMPGLPGGEIPGFPIPGLPGDDPGSDAGSYRWHRKNMRRNGDGTVGVDLNRNYGFMWGTGGSSKDPSSDVYMGPSAFSEPETAAIKKFVEDRPNIKVLLSYHTFSELILYPWGHKYDGIENKTDLAAYEKMARRMAQWNGYTPQQSSDLYIASGDTTDWAYGAHGIFAFTFELSPKDMWGGGFYPGAGVLDQVFQANVQPALYLMDMADNPHRSLDEPGEFGFIRRAP